MPALYVVCLDNQGEKCLNGFHMVAAINTSGVIVPLKIRISKKIMS
jgi:hypothetical protein